MSDENRINESIRKEFIESTTRYSIKNVRFVEHIPEEYTVVYFDGAKKVKEKVFM